MDFTKQIIEKKAFEIEGGGTVTLIKADSSYATAKAVLEEVERHEKAQKAGKKTNEVLEADHEERLSDIYAENLIVGWSGIEIAGRNLPFSTANAKKLMRHKQFKAFVLTTVTHGDFSEEIDLGLDFGDIEKN